MENTTEDTTIDESEIQKTIIASEVDMNNETVSQTETNVI